jgi:hypothetical protein
MEVSINQFTGSWENGKMGKTTAIEDLQTLMKIGYIRLVWHLR